MKNVLSLAAVLLMLAAGMGAPAPTAARDTRGPHESTYTSPNWSYHVRWHGDEWAMDEESSEDGVDTLWLSDFAGNVAGFVGSPSYGGDSITCLDQKMREIESIPGVADIEIVTDEVGESQLWQDPWWSWVILLARLPIDGELVDHAIYLDCRTIVPGLSVLMRTLAGPAAGFESNSVHFRVVQAALTRSAWIVDPQNGFLSVGEPSIWIGPVFYDQDCGGYPRPGRVVFDREGAERAMLSVVDGTIQYSRDQDLSEAIRVVAIENLGVTPLTIDAGNFVYQSPEINRTDRFDVAPANPVWEDTGDTAPRKLAPGAIAIARITWPDSVAFPDDGVQLVFRHDDLREEIDLGSIGVPGGCGAGSRPKLRLSR